MGWMPTVSDGPPCFVCGLTLVAGNNVIRVERDGAVRWAHGHHDIADVDGQRGRLEVVTMYRLEES